MNTYTVFQDFGTFKMFEPVENGDFVKSVNVPGDVGESVEEERKWFADWCAENNVTPVFEN